MTEQAKRPEDPTADFLDEIRPEETPWRTERPAVATTPEPVPTEAGKWARTKKAVRTAAPYVQTAAMVGWFAAAASGDDSYDAGYDAGFDAGMDGSS